MKAGAIALPTKVAFFTIILYNSEDSIRDIKPGWIHPCLKRHGWSKLQGWKNILICYRRVQKFRCLQCNYTEEYDTWLGNSKLAADEKNTSKQIFPLMLKTDQLCSLINLRSERMHTFPLLVSPYMSEVWFRRSTNRLSHLLKLLLQ